MSKRLSLHCVGWAGIFLAVGLLTASVGVASPPVTVRGIELPTVLSFYDQAREAAVAAGTDRAARIASMAESPDESAEESDETDPSDGGLSTIDTIVLDPGHGARNLGAVGVTGVAEKYLTLELAYALRQRLQQRYPDLRVVLTRYWDTGVSLDERTHLANRVDADLLLSLHYNAATHQRAVGYETYFLDTRKAIPARHDVGRRSAPSAGSSAGDELGGEPRFATGGDQTSVIRRALQRAHKHRLSSILAETVQSRLGAHLDSVDRGVKQANFAVLRESLMPAVVVEAGFLSHPEEGEACLEAEHRQRVVDGLVEAIRTFDRKRAQTDPRRASK
ncbi:MAG: N-acetylmuramoyl-L-alanine amidase [Bradymonadaceae bacterium]